MPRTDNDIRTIRVDAEPPGIIGWTVDIAYKDNKRAMFAIDLGDNMVERTLECIKKQMLSHQETTNG